VRGNFDGESVICVANGWLKEYDQQFFYGNVLTATHIKLASITFSNTELFTHRSHSFQYGLNAAR